MSLSPTCQQCSKSPLASQSFSSHLQWSEKSAVWIRQVVVFTGYHSRAGGTQWMLCKHLCGWLGLYPASFSNYFMETLPLTRHLLCAKHFSFLSFILTATLQMHVLLHYTGCSGKQGAEFTSKRNQSSRVHVSLSRSLVVDVPRVGTPR